jgi:hypothetical protein
VHEGVESARGERIPDWAHRDVLYMLIDYSERAHDILERPLTRSEQHELYDVFRRVGLGLGIPGVPATYREWRDDRVAHIRRDLARSDGTDALFRQYRRHLGRGRFAVLRAVQSGFVHEHALTALGQRRSSWIRPMLRAYRALAVAGFKPLIRQALMPSRYLSAVNALDVRAAAPAAKPRQWRRTWQLSKAG